MKCQEREFLIEEFIRSLPKVEHEFDQITVTDEYEHWICKHCLAIEKRIKEPGVRSTDE